MVEALAMAEDTKPSKDEKFVGIQVSPISLVDEGVDQVLDMVSNRFGVNAIFLGTVSWLALKVGRRVSHEVEGWPDHGAQDARPLGGGSYLKSRPEAYNSTFMKDVRASDKELEGIDILAETVPAARARGMKIYADLMEPMFNYLGHGSSQSVDIPNITQALQVDVLGRITSEPCINNPNYRNWLQALVEDHCRNYDIDGIMWCNERRSPLDAALTGQPPHCFCDHCCSLAAREGIDVEKARASLEAVWRMTSGAQVGQDFVDGPLVEYLRVIYQYPEALLWERFWVERNKAMDRELYGTVKFCDSRLEFGLNVWNRNHLNPWRKAQWPWREQAQWTDWVKPIVYQHQSGGIFADEWLPLLGGLLRDLDPDLVMELVKAVLGLDEARWSSIVQTGLDPDTYVYGQCVDAIRGLDDERVKVYMGVGVDAPRKTLDQAACTPDIVYRSVLAAYRAGGNGIIYGPAYAGMNLTSLDGGARALRELGLHDG